MHEDYILEDGLGHAHKERDLAVHVSTAVTQGDPLGKEKRTNTCDVSTAVTQEELLERDKNSKGNLRCSWIFNHGSPPISNSVSQTTNQQEIAI